MITPILSYIRPVTWHVFIAGRQLSMAWQIIVDVSYTPFRPPLPLSLFRGIDCSSLNEVRSLSHDW